MDESVGCGKRKSQQTDVFLPENYDIPSTKKKTSKEKPQKKKPKSTPKIPFYDKDAYDSYSEFASSHHQECLLCSKGGSLQYCSACNGSFHSYCLEQPYRLFSMETPWFCPGCQDAHTSTEEDEVNSLPGDNSRASVAHKFPSERISERPPLMTSSVSKDKTTARNGASNAGSLVVYGPAKQGVSHKQKKSPPKKLNVSDPGDGDKKPSASPISLVQKKQESAQEELVRPGPKVRRPPLRESTPAATMVDPTPSDTPFHITIGESRSRFESKLAAAIVDPKQSDTPIHAAFGESASRGEPNKSKPAATMEDPTPSDTPIKVLRGDLNIVSPPAKASAPNALVKTSDIHQEDFDTATSAKPSDDREPLANEHSWRGFAWTLIFDVTTATLGNVVEWMLLGEDPFGRKTILVPAFALGLGHGLVGFFFLHSCDRIDMAPRTKLVLMQCLLYPLLCTLARGFRCWTLNGRDIDEAFLFTISVLFVETTMFAGLLSLVRPLAKVLLKGRLVLLYAIHWTILYFS